MSKKPAGNYSSEIPKAQFSNRWGQASYSCIIGILQKQVSAVAKVLTLRFLLAAVSCENSIITAAYHFFHI